jgi:hypothetical protein
LHLFVEFTLAGLSMKLSLVTALQLKKGI